MIYYEQPLNERVRTFLRLDYLFKQARHNLQRDTVWDSRAALDSLLSVMNVFGRTELKADVIKELERHIGTLSKLEHVPNIDHTQLSSILDELDVALDRCHAIQGQIGQELKENEFLNGIKQRASLPGGACEFDMPIFHFWLQRPEKERKADVCAWLNIFEPVELAISVILRIIRASNEPSHETAEAGFFQQNLDTNSPSQMLCVGLPDDSPYLPEISAGKHRFTIRFLEYAGHERPLQTDMDIAFELTRCIL